MKIWSRDRAIILAMAGALMLTGCGDGDAELEQGIACFQAGGEWVDVGDHGVIMKCTFEQSTTPAKRSIEESMEICEPVVDAGEWFQCLDAVEAGYEWSGLGA